MNRAYAVVPLFISSVHALHLSSNLGSATKISDKGGCKAQFERLSGEMQHLLDNPELLCTPTPLSSNFTDRNQVEAVEFPVAHLDVKPYSDHKCAHVMIEGSESSGSRFMAKIVKASFDLQEGDVTKSTFVGDMLHTERKAHDDTLSCIDLYHVSQPEGSTCTGASIKTVPILDDYGCLQTDPGCKMPLHTHARFLTNVTSVVQRFRDRRESIKVVQTVRDPDISMLANQKGHCSDVSREVAENEQAFRIMLEAKDLPEVITICYEQMLEQGKPYIAERFQKAGFKADLAHFPDIVDRNLAYSIDQRSCTFSASAYMMLCPDSPHTKALSKMGCTTLQ